MKDYVTNTTVKINQRLMYKTFQLCFIQAVKKIQLPGVESQSNHHVIDAQFHWEVCYKVIRRNIDAPNDTNEENLGKVSKLAYSTMNC